MKTEKLTRKLKEMDRDERSDLTNRDLLVLLRADGGSGFRSPGQRTRVQSRAAGLDTDQSNAARVPTKGRVEDQGSGGNEGVVLVGRERVRKERPEEV